MCVFINFTQNSVLLAKLTGPQSSRVSVCNNQHQKFLADQWLMEEVLARHHHDVHNNYIYISEKLYNVMDGHR